MKITDYEKVEQLVDNNVFLLDGPNGTKGILAKDLAAALFALMSSKDLTDKIKLSELGQITSLTSSDKFLVGTSDGNKAIAGSDAMFAILDAFAPVETRRKIFRGKNLGTAFTSAQKAAVKDGTFKGLWLGDYWVIGGHTWRIADFDYWWNCGDTAFTKHHLVIVPDTSLYTEQMNTSNVTTGGYAGSKMFTSGLANAKTLAKSAFGAENVLVHREYLDNAMTSGYPSAGAWYDVDVDLMNEVMVYGSFIFRPAGNGSVVVSRHTTANSQLALMAASPKFIKTRETYWLKDPVSAALFAGVIHYGLAAYDGASSTYGVRPAFAVGQA